MRTTSLATNRKHASVIDGKLGSEPVCDLRAEQGVEPGFATQNVARKVKAPKAALCFVQGWRISEALGLAWQDLGPTKTRGATGVQMLGRTVASLLRARHDLHEADRAAYPGPWPTVEYDGEQLDPVFTTADAPS